jgi:ABC-2 type transport system ATP-binding protein
VVSVFVARPSLDDVYLRHAGRSFQAADREAEGGARREAEGGARREAEGGARREAEGDARREAGTSS